MDYREVAMIGEYSSPQRRRERRDKRREDQPKQWTCVRLSTVSALRARLPLATLIASLRKPTCGAAFQAAMPPFVGACFAGFPARATEPNTAASETPSRRNSPSCVRSVPGTSSRVALIPLPVCQTGIPAAVSSNPSRSTFPAPLATMNLSPPHKQPLCPRSPTTISRSN